MKNLKSQWGRQMTKEALKMAMEALEGVLDDAPKVLEASITGGLYEVIQCRDAITAIKEALAQPQQEPVAWHYPGGKPDQCTTDKAYAEKDPAWTPMYYKQEWVGLTDEEAYKIYRDCGDLNVRINIARAIEAKLKDKNNG